MHHWDANYASYYFSLCTHKTDPHVHFWKTVLSLHRKCETCEQGLGEEQLTLEAKQAGRHVHGIHSRAAHFKHGNIKKAFKFIPVACKPVYSRTLSRGINHGCIFYQPIFTASTSEYCAKCRLLLCPIVVWGWERRFFPQPIGEYGEALWGSERHEGRKNMNSFLIKVPISWTHHECTGCLIKEKYFRPVMTV